MRIAHVSVIRNFLRVVAAWLTTLIVAGCAQQNDQVVVYVAHDRVLSEPVLKAFELAHSIEVLAVYDTEANKSIGLTNRLLSEQSRPRADVFWNNEIIQTLRLAERGIVDAPARIRATGSRGTLPGFAARSRVILVNLDAAGTASREALGFKAFVDPRWRGRAALANPRLGTTATHFSVLYTVLGEQRFRTWLRALRANEVAVLPGNSQVRDAVARGEFAFGLTDTDDAAEAVREGKPVRMEFVRHDIEDAERPLVGAILIPNTAVRVRGGPHPQAAEELLSFLHTADVERQLAAGRGAQIPIHNAVPDPPELPPLQMETWAQVDFTAAARNFERMLGAIDAEWRGD